MFVKRLRLVTIEVYFELVSSTHLFALPALQPRLSRHLPINLLVSKCLRPPATYLVVRSELLATMSVSAIIDTV
jgi:hypothetical protein